MTTRDELERAYAAICGAGIVYHLSDRDLADAIIAAANERRTDNAQADVNDETAELGRLMS